MNNNSIFNKKIHEPIPQYLYHYTSSKGLLGIIKEGEIWVTKIQYLNDSSELNLAFTLIRNEIENQLERESIIRSRNELEEMKKRLDNINFSFNESDIGGINLAVTSFSKNANQLSQWRGYCKVGDGYALGLYGDKLKEEIQNTAYLLPCIYKEDEQKELVRELVNCCSLQDPGEDRETEEMPQINEISFEKAVLLISPMIKDKGFEDEEEWRLIFKGGRTDPEFRSGNSSIIPYWKINLNLNKTLYQIVIGPTPLKDQSKNAVRTLLRKKTLFIIHRADGVINSDIPFGNV